MDPGQGPTSSSKGGAAVTAAGDTEACESSSCVGGSHWEGRSECGVRAAPRGKAGNRPLGPSLHNLLLRDQRARGICQHAPGLPKNKPAASCTLSPPPRVSMLRKEPDGCRGSRAGEEGGLGWDWGAKSSGGPKHPHHGWSPRLAMLADNTATVGAGGGTLRSSELCPRPRVGLRK